MNTNDITNSIEEVEDRLLSLPSEYLLCRDIRHAWRIGTDFSVYDAGIEGPPGVLLVSRSLTCDRCGTERVTVYKAGGWRLERLRTFYRYASEYQMKGMPQGVRASDYVADVQYKQSKLWAGRNTR